ncbi:hypothetical protein [Paenibacillus oceani]|uniref:Uncharacterized protein n=1 Tax=Paenibacillus oceani TaxID=2772510 RepID=A0A927C693_9BACL|nr:hypothetical protein [Paenibacillus oceani]MBD2860526.1 hypothetical protein [Paenibacillus oceani]
MPQMKWWNGSSWVVPKAVRTWDGSQWVERTKMKFWGGVSWVDVTVKPELYLLRQGLIVDPAVPYAPEKYGDANIFHEPANVIYGRSLSLFANDGGVTRLTWNLGNVNMSSYKRLNIMVYARDDRDGGEWHLQINRDFSIHRQIIESSRYPSPSMRTLGVDIALTGTSAKTGITLYNTAYSDGMSQLYVRDLWFST